MLKKLLVLMCVFAVAAFAASVVRVPQGLEAFPYVQMLGSGDDGAVSRGSVSDNVLMAEGEQAGTTTYDYQVNGAGGNRVAIDADGNAHICWMESQTDDFADRNIHYNFWDKATSAFVWPTGIKASGTNRAGYTTGAVMPDGRSVLAFHAVPTSGTDSVTACVVVDAAQGAGAFSVPVAIDINPPFAPEQVIWPHMVVGSDGVIHVAGHINDTSAVGRHTYYSRSTDGGATFSPWVEITADGGDDPAIAVSKDGQKVCIAFLSQADVQGGGKDFACGHINYKESTNGGTSWGAAQRITDGMYADEIINTDTLMFIFANQRDLDVAYDDAGKIHILYGEGWHQWNNGAYYYPKMWGRTMYWDEAHGFSCPTARHPMFHSINTDTGDTLWEFDSLGMWGVASPVGEEHGGQYGPQLAIWGNNIIATWGGQWDSLDLSAGGTANADLYGSVTTDGGNTWKPLADYVGLNKDVWAHVTNITNTHAPGAGVGSTPDEDYHTCWPVVGSDAILHITYIKDLFAGSVISNPDCPSYGIITNSPAMYLRYTVKVGVITDTSAVEEVPGEISGITLVGGSVFTGAVSFNINNPTKDAAIKIYDASGSLVDILNAGSSHVTWNVDGFAPGVYFYTFTSPSATSNGKFVLVR